MLNEERVKLMVKLASYESKEGKEDSKISSYYKKDYVSINRWFTVLWTTVGYVLIVGLLSIGYMEQLMDTLTLPKLITLAVIVIGGYVLMVIVYCMVAGRYYEKKHVKARRRIKKYSHDLLVLGKVYEKEKR